MGYLFKLLVALTLIHVCVGANDAINKDIVYKKYERKIDLTSQLVKSMHTVVIENTGPSPVKYFLFMLTAEEYAKVSYIGAQIGSYSLNVAETTIANHPGYHFYRLDLRDVLQATKSSAMIEVEVVLSDALVPYPASIQQGEKQLMVYAGSHYATAAYHVSSQTTTITLPSPNIESYTRLKPTSHADTTITYGPYENIPAFTMDPLKVHYESSGPFLSLVRLERWLEVSHWGNIAVEEKVELLHTGAKLKGPFSRYDYQRDHNSHTTVKSFRSLLPASARDVYYRDEIGNISTSNLRVRDDSVELDLRPRFPLFGGWKTNYKIGYNVPSYEYLYNSGDKYALKMRLLDHVFDDMVVEELTLKIVLPEGVTDVQLTTPYPVRREPNTLLPTYLDTVGRVVVTARASRLTASHIQDFTLTYSFPALLMLQEPMLVVVAFMALFIVVMMWIRLDLTLSPDRLAEAKMRVSSHCALAATRHRRRAALYRSMLDEAAKQHGAGNPPQALAQFQASVKRLTASVREETQGIAELLGRIRADSTEAADRVHELQKHDKEAREAVFQQCSNLEKVLAKKMAKQAYADAETTLIKRRDEAMERTRAIVALL